MKLGRVTFLAVMAGVVLLLSPAWGGFDPRVEEILVTENEGKIWAFVSLSDWFSPGVDEALQEGLPVTVRYQIQIRGERAMWKDRLVSEAIVTMVLSYDRVKETYRFLKRSPTINFPEEKETRAREEIRDWSSQIKNLPVVSLSEIEPGRRYYIRARTEIKFSQRGFPFNLLLFFIPTRNFTTAWTNSHRFTISDGEK